MKNIIFDLGGVILKDEPITFLKKLNIDDNTYNQLKIFFDDWNKLDLGEESLEDKYNKCNFPIEYDNLYKDKLINYYKYREIDIRLIKCINKLKENGYNVYVISDNNKECSLYYKNNPSFNNIDGWVMSCDYHTTKDIGNIFDIFINKFNLKPEECYFIDNNAINIKVAKRHGIIGSVFNTNDDINRLYDDMKNNNINTK